MSCILKIRTIFLFVCSESRGRRAVSGRGSGYRAVGAVRSRRSDYGGHGHIRLERCLQVHMRGKHAFKGTVAWDGFSAHCILSRIERKDLIFFSLFQYLPSKARFNSFSALAEYAEWYFPVGQAINLNYILFSWGSDKIYPVSHSWNMDPMESSKVVDESLRTLQIR